jgi:TonB family protein
MHQASFSFEPSAPQTPPHTAIRPDPSPKLTISWTPFWPQFVANVGDFILRREPLPYRATSPPGRFWPDVFVQRPMPWRDLVASAFLHAALIAFVLATGKFWLTRSTVRLQDPVASTPITYYKVDEFLPELTSSAPPARAKAASKGDPEFARQRIVSIPPIADNSQQTIVNPQFPQTLPFSAPMPNLVIAAPNVTKPKLEVPVDLPFILPKRPTLQSQPQTRLAKLPDLPHTEVIEPPAPDVARKLNAMDLPIPQVEAINAPKLTHDSLTARKIDVHEFEAAAPPSSAEVSSARKLDLPNVEPIAPPSAAASVNTGAREAVGQILALNVRPVDPGPALKVPQGSRSGVFAATPDGRPGAAGTPHVQASATPSDATGVAGGGASPNSPGQGANASGSGTNRSASPLPPGISVTGGGPSSPGGAVVASAPPKAADSPNRTFAFNRPPAIDVPKQLPPASPPGESSRQEDAAVFGDRRVYAMQINLPNLTSAGGSWIIRFAERDEVPRPGELSTPVALNKVDPAYPTEMMKNRIEGIVTLYAVIRADGTVGEIRVLRGFNDRLNENARIALSRWKFRPASKNGEPVELEAVVQIPFRARRIGF